jgi:signal transduction histidine kinase
LLVPLVVAFFLDASVLPSPAAMATWNPLMVFFRVLTDLSLGLVCTVVSVTFLRLARRVKDPIPFLRFFLVFGACMVMGSVFNVLAALTRWSFFYWIWLILRYATAISSVAAAFAITPLLPQLMRLVRLVRSTDDQQFQLTERNRELHALNSNLQREVRERELAEVRSLTNLRRLQSIIDSLPLGAIALDEHGSILHLNRQCCLILAIDSEPESFIDRPIDALFSVIEHKAADQAAYRASLDVALRSPEPISHEVRLLDGRIVAQDALSLGSDVADHGKLLLYRDITRERRVDAVKSEFMSLASHQLRTPLTSIRWALGRLEKSLGRSAAPEQVRLLESGLTSSRRMAHTIDTMLVISRIEAGKVRADVSEIKLGAFLNEIRVECRHAYETKALAFTLDCPPHLLVRTDPDILAEVVKNLCSNAIKYTPEHGRVSVGARADGDRIFIEVRDTGLGIPAYQQDKVFGKFFRGDNVVSADTEGTGLGLYLVSLLVRILEGSIAFRSVEGKGSVFTLDLPVARAADNGEHAFSIL